MERVQSTPQSFQFTAGSSSSPVSTPPQSPSDQDTIVVDSTLATGITSAHTNSFNGKKEPKVRKSRKDKDADVKGKKTRKPRDPDKPPARKKLKAAERPPNVTTQTRVTDFVNTASSAQTPLIRPAMALAGSLPQSLTQSGKGEAEYARPQILHTDLPRQAPSIRPASGQRFDPIRSASAENAANLHRLATPQPTMHARASPSIASLLDNGPLEAFRSGTLSSVASPYPSVNERKSHISTNNVQTLQSSGLKASPTSPIGEQPQAIPSANAPTLSQNSSSIPVAYEVTAIAKGPKVEAVDLSSSPKAVRQRPAAPPVPLGSGLLSNAAFGKTDAVQQELKSVPNQCIVIDVPIGKDGSSYINFMKEVENKYGFDVAHPRLAEHKRRMAQVAAAGAALEGTAGSADDMSLDISDAESNVEMAAADEESTNAEGGKKKQRRPRANAYDKNDDFIDDSELLWEEQALASKDGYFVWSGPLVPEPEKPNTDRPEGTGRRGRGRGRGGSTRGDGTGRGRGRGSRGGANTTLRKPRITKAEKDRLEAEKEERLKLAVNAQRPAQYPSITA